MGKKAAPATAEDILGGDPTAGSDILGGEPAAKATKKAKPATKAAPAKKASAKPAAKAAKPAAEKPAKAAKAASANRGTKGSGKFFPDPAVMDPLIKALRSQKKEISTREAAEKHGVETWQARLAMNALTKEGKGSLAKVGNMLVYTP